MDVGVLSAADARSEAEVDAFLDACEASVAQQTLCWRDVICEVDRDEPRFLLCRDRGELVGILPAYRFEGRLGAILTSVPQAGALGGVACERRGREEAIYAQLLTSFGELAREWKCELATAISSPFWPDAVFYQRHLAPDYVLENQCLALDLEGLDTELRFSGTSSALRRNLRKAHSGPMWIDEAQTPANVESWYTIHTARHAEIGATPLPWALVSGVLRHGVPRDKARFIFVREEASGEMIAGGLYLCHGAVVDAYMPATRSDRTHLAPSYLLAHRSIAWARARGARFYNWQGSPPGSGVHRFKAQWGSRELHYGFWTRVTGDASAFLRSSVEEITEAYPWHYVLPYDRLGSPESEGTAISSRAAAWKAAGGSRP